MVAAFRRRPEVRVKNVDAAVYVVGEAISGLARWLVHEAPEDVDKRRISDEVVTMLDRYVRAGAR